MSSVKKNTLRSLVFLSVFNDSNEEMERKAGGTSQETLAGRIFYKKNWRTVSTPLFELLISERTRAFSRPIPQLWMFFFFSVI